ncbi:MAG: putative glycoside hydrolase [Patescibacteria group bacterium]
MNRIINRKILTAIISVVSTLSFLFIASAWQAANAELENITAQILGPLSSAEERAGRGLAVSSERQKSPKQTAKAVYLTAYSAGSSKKLNEIISLIDRTELNAVVMDIKDYSGLVLFKTKVPLANKLHLVDNRYSNLSSTIKKLHDHHIYVIARQTVFQDPVLAEKSQDLALKKVGGGLWRDHKGLAWVDPTKKGVWDYNVAIAKDAVEYGFDEINFDYIRFPSDGNMKTVVYSNLKEKKYQVMAKFYEYLNSKLRQLPVWISLDFFGFVMEKTGEDDMNIGQRLEDALPMTDYISPMMYPSHYPSGHLGLANPAAHPALVIRNGMTLGAPRFEGKRAELRPWIQAFNMGAVYDGSMIRAQIDEIEKFPNAGWLLWNAANRYSGAGLKAE